MAIKKSQTAVADSALTRFFDPDLPDAVRSSVTRIAVVVHVVWSTRSQNISDAQIASQIHVLNRDHRRSNPDLNHAPAPFLPLRDDARIEFFLADVDPQGEPSTGILRRQTSVASFCNDGAVKSSDGGGAHGWPAQRYLNIWVCQLDGDLPGHAQFSDNPVATDGIVILHSAFGTIGTAAAPFHLGRTASREIGHWLSQNHVWCEDACPESACVAGATALHEID
jgi:hypothetical protein